MGQPKPSHGSQGLCVWSDDGWPRGRAPGEKYVAGGGAGRTSSYRRGPGRGPVRLAYAHMTGLLSPAAKPVQEAVAGTCASVSLGLGQARVPSRSASRVLAPTTVTLAAWTDKDARVRAALASRCSWREKRDAGQVARGCAAWSRARWAPNPHILGPETSPKLQLTVKYAVCQEYLVFYYANVNP